MLPVTRPLWFLRNIRSAQTVPLKARFLGRRVSPKKGRYFAVLTNRRRYPDDYAGLDRVDKMGSEPGLAPEPELTELRDGQNG